MVQNDGKFTPAFFKAPADSTFRSTFADRLFVSDGVPPERLYHGFGRDRPGRSANRGDARARQGGKVMNRILFDQNNPEFTLGAFRQITTDFDDGRRIGIAGCADDDPSRS